jgi:hypothetical protein
MTYYVYEYETPTTKAFNSTRTSITLPTMNRFILPVSRLAVCRSIGVRTLVRPITVQQTKTETVTTITDADTPIPLGREGITGEFFYLPPPFS